MIPLKKDLSERIPLGKLKYFDLILKIIKTVETVIRLLNLLLTHDLSRGLMIHTPIIIVSPIYRRFLLLKSYLF